MLSIHQTSGHNFYGDDSDGTEACTTCGATFAFEDIVSDPEFPESVDRTYQANNGDAPNYCPGTDREHGEAPCQIGRNGNGCEASQDGPCEHTSHDCNCLFCA